MVQSKQERMTQSCYELSEQICCQCQLVPIIPDMLKGPASCWQQQQSTENSKNESSSVSCMAMQVVSGYICTLFAASKFNFPYLLDCWMLP
jgi:hypothetical protein